ncbi:MAG: MBL fold metallo-hydrolase [Chitinispirillaceae bacterium]|jgi:phosphoribosyl 1,2-cyclic phosphodiesterase|nr:MBL fold metallo-hydrolase [Chitinispirillaceae bacterium]
MSLKTKVCVLASTSSGNCTVIWNDTVSLLVDCGTSLSYTEQSLENLGLSLKKLSGVFITHCHSDHVNPFTLKKLLQHRVPVYCNVKVANALKKIHPHLHDKPSSFTPFTEAIPCEGFSFSPFGVPHDSRGGCFGYSFFLPNSSATHKISIATDIGFTEPGLVAHFADSDIIVIESNHDVTLLAESSRPQWLKDRIVKTGHLSNDQCGEFIAGVLAASVNLPAAIVLAHISQECNTNSHATTCMRETLAIAKRPHITVVETFREKPSLVVSV